MKVKIWKRPRSFEGMIEMFSSGRHTTFTGKFDVKADNTVPVLWFGQRASMKFDRENDYMSYNPYATRLLDNPRLTIRGPVYIIMKVEERYKLRVWATNQEVTDAIAHLDLSAPPVIFNVGVRVPQQDIYAATKDDLLWIRMGL